MFHLGRYRPPVLALLAGFFVVVPLAVNAGESDEPADRPVAADSSAAPRPASTADSSVAAASTSADSSTTSTVTAGNSVSFVFPAATDAAADALLQSGDGAAALALYERELLAARSSLPPEHPALAMTHDRLGTVAWKIGDYERARTELEAALLLYERARGAEFPPMADALGRLGTIALELGETQAAVALQRRALAIAEKERGSGSRTAAALERLGTALAASGDVKAAEAAHLRALELRVKGDTDSLGVAACLHLLAGDARRLGAPERARAYLLRSRSILVGGYGPEHPGLDVSILGLAALAAADGDLDRARAHGREAVAIRRRALGPDHPLLADALATYAGSLLRTGHNSDAVDAALEAEAIRRDHLRFLARSLPDSEALRYGTRLASGLGAAVAASIRTWDSTMVERVWDAAARSRALVLDEMASRHHEAALRTDSATVALAAEAARTRVLLARVSARGPEGMDGGAYRGTLQRLRTSSEETERKLLDRNPAARAGSVRANAGLAEARAGLHPGTGLVSLVRYLDPAAGSRRAGGGPIGSGGQETWSYAAFVTAGPTAHARVIPLGDAAELDSLVAAWRRSVTAEGGAGGDPNAATGERRLGRILRQRLWDPIAPHLQGVERVVFVPDGAFHLVNPMALPLGEKRFLVEEGPTFQIVSSERDLVGPARGAVAGAGFLALADPDFDAPRRSMSWVDPVREWIRDAPEGSEPVYRGSRPCAGAASTHWASLPGSAREVEEIARLWEQSGRGASQVFRGAAATEGAFKKHAPGKRALHLATHGFFAGPCEPGSSPLLRSGLVLAGANRGVADSAEDARTEDGILTADEISGMDLAGVESAVLSGCETGVGVVLAGEGVLGLRRAFEIAGVQSLVLTLWPVTDDAAHDWAVRFYEARLSKGLDPASAARDASRRVLEERRTAGASVDPSTWGAFIAAGR